MLLIFSVSLCWFYCVGMVRLIVSCGVGVCWCVMISGRCLWV